MMHGTRSTRLSFKLCRNDTGFLGCCFPRCGHGKRMGSKDQSVRPAEHIHSLPLDPFPREPGRTSSCLILSRPL
jgi:hypothetical protein